jgi:nucleotide-binding universal stress UspA family protein
LRQGPTAGLILGSVSQACAQYAHGPVVVVRGSASTDGAGRVVVGVDGSPGSLVALRFAAAAARRRGAPLKVVHVWQDTDHAAHGRSGPLHESAKAQADREWQNILRSTLAVAPDVEIISNHVTGYAPSVLLKASNLKELRCWWWDRGGTEAGRDSCWDRSPCAASPQPRAL